MELSEKKTVSAKVIVDDIRAGATNDFLMKKYGLSDKGLQSLFKKLLDANAITQVQLDQRVSRADPQTGEVEIIEEPPSPGPQIGQVPQNRPVTTNAGPSATRNTPSVFKCPSCGLPQNYEFKICPQCGVIVEKYKAKSVETEQAKEVAPPAAPQQVVQDDLRKTPPRGNRDTVSKDTPVKEPSSEYADKMAQLRDAHTRGILSQAEFVKKSEELTLQARRSEALDKLKALLAAGIITQEEFEAKKADPLQYESKLAKLQEALESGVLGQSEFDRKKKELIGIEGLPGPRSKEGVPPSVIPENAKAALGFLTEVSLGEKLIVAASALAVISLFFPWAEAGIAKWSGFQQQGFLLLALYAYPLIQTLRRADMSKIVAGICTGLSVVLCVLFIESKSVILFGEEINAAGTGLYIFTFCSILLGVGVYLYKSKREPSSIEPTLSRPLDERMTAKSVADAAIRGEETELGSGPIVFTKWLIIHASGKMIVTNQRLLFRCEYWWVFAIITSGLSYYVSKIGKKPLEFRWTDISEIVPKRHLSICDGILIRMNSGVEHAFFFPLLHGGDKDKLMGLIEGNLR